MNRIGLDQEQYIVFGSVRSCFSGVIISGGYFNEFNSVNVTKKDCIQEFMDSGCMV